MISHTIPFRGNPWTLVHVKYIHKLSIKHKPMIHPKRIGGNRMIRISLCYFIRCSTYRFLLLVALSLLQVWNRLNEIEESIHTFSAHYYRNRDSGSIIVARAPQWHFKDPLFEHVSGLGWGGSLCIQSRKLWMIVFVHIEFCNRVSVFFL